MATLITDPQLEEDLIAQRQARGADKFDEVWEGVYIMSPMANDEHQFLVKELTTILAIAIDWQRGVGQSTYSILKHLVNEIELRLTRDVDTPIGILTHHLMHDRGLNDRLGKLVRVLDTKRAVRWFNPRASSLFVE